HPSIPTAYRQEHLVIFVDIEHNKTITPGLQRILVKKSIARHIPVAEHKGYKTIVLADSFNTTLVGRMGKVVQGISRFLPDRLWNGATAKINDIFPGKNTPLIAIDRIIQGLGEIETRMAGIILQRAQLATPPLDRRVMGLQEMVAEYVLTGRVHHRHFIGKTPVVAHVEIIQDDIPIAVDKKLVRKKSIVIGNRHLLDKTAGAVELKDLHSRIVKCIHAMLLNIHIPQLHKLTPSPPGLPVFPFQLTVERITKDRLGFILIH